MPTVQQLAVHPPLTSLRSFAPPYASEGGWVAENHGNHGSKPPPFAKRKGARGMLACLPPTLCITFPLMYPYKRGSHALSRKAGGCRRISVVSRPNQFAANYACQATSGQLSILRASPAHIAPLARVPLRKRWGRGGGKSWQSFPHHGNHGSKPPPFAFTSCHSECSEESPPFAKRKGARGMLP